MQLIVVPGVWVVRVRVLRVDVGRDRCFSFVCGLSWFGLCGADALTLAVQIFFRFVQLEEFCEQIVQLRIILYQT